MYHTIDICQDIAEKLRSAESVRALIEEEIRKGVSPITQWPNLTLASGLPGIVCFYAAMDHAFPGKQWDKTAHEYLKHIVQIYETEENRRGYSLFYGLAGICFAGHLCNKEMRYQQLLKKLDSFLLNEIEQNLEYIHKNVIEADSDPFPSHYNLTEGLSGVIAYLMLRQDDRWFQKITTDCINSLIALLSKEKMIDNHHVASWIVSQKNDIFDIEAEEFSKGCFVLSTPFNIIGCLSVLSLAAWHIKSSPSLEKAIRKIADWLCQQQVRTSEGVSWPYLLPLKSATHHDHSRQALSQGSWGYGRPAIAKSLYLAGRALQDKKLISLAEESFVSQFNSTQNSKLDQDSSLSFGKGGLLAITYLMAKQTNNSILVKEAYRLEGEVKKSYHPNFPFGFQRSDGLGRYHLNDPGLFSGAIGSALALLLVSGLTEQVPWERAFLIR